MSVSASQGDRNCFEIYRCPVCGRTFDAVTEQLTPMCAGRAGSGRRFDKASHEPAECELLTVRVVEGEGRP